MKLWPFSKKPSDWSSLSSEQKGMVARRIGGMLLSLAGVKTFGRGYEAVTEPYSQQRRQSTIEHAGEDRQMTPAQRARIVNLQRDMMRNSPVRGAQDQQLRVNVVGAVGGKMYAAFPKGYDDAAKAVMDYFNKKWFPRAEFTFRKNFNWLLKTALTAQDTNGNVVLVFDDGILTGGHGTGRIRGFEGDEIASVPILEDYFPKGFRQSAGFVYNTSGMFCGAFVSTTQRGRAVFDPKLGILKLKQDPFDDDALVNWIALGDMRRFNQGRAVSPLTAAINTLVDLHETVGSEAQAAKLNAQLVGQILEDETADLDDGEPEAFADVGSGSSDGEPKVVKFTTKQLNAIGAHFDKMPRGLKIDLLRTERPNPNMPAYIDFLSGLVGGAKGLARVYSTLKAQTSYTAFRGEQVMTEPSFEEFRQDLERDVCDWAARCVITRAIKLGLITETLPEGWERMIAWRWPKMREVSEKDAQAALQLKLQNGITSLKRELGPGEVDAIIAERAEEKKKFDELGLVYPGTTTVSGQIKDEGGASADDEKKEEQDK